MFGEVFYHRLKYFLTPQFDLYRNIRDWAERGTWRDKSTFMADKGFRVLDYGCGNGVGTMLLRLKEWEAVGIDSDAAVVHFAHRCFGHLCSFNHDDWAHDGPHAAYGLLFDLVTCIEVIEHVDDPAVLISHLKAALNDCGIAIFSTLNHNSQYRKNDCHVGKFHIADFRALLLDYFPMVKITDYQLEEKLPDDSTRTPVVAVCYKR